MTFEKFISKMNEERIITLWFFIKTLFVGFCGGVIVSWLFSTATLL